MPLTATHQTTPEAGQDYHDTGYYHNHSPESMEEANIEGGNDPRSSKDDGENPAIGKTLDLGRRKNKHTRNKKRKTSKRRTPKRMRPRWSNVQ